MKILIVAPYCSLPGESGFNRFLFLARHLSKNHNVTLVTSQFQHGTKTHRMQPSDEKNLLFKLIYEPGYKKNVSLRRLWSHYIFLKNFQKWFEQNAPEEKYDLVYSAYPLIATNEFLGKLKKKYNFKLVVDVQDVWPESFSAVLPFLRHIPPELLPYSRKAKNAYMAADKLVAVSETYLQRALRANKYAKGMVAYIGSDFELIRTVVAKKLDTAKTHFLYMGSFGHSYDIKTMLNAFILAKYEGLNFHLHLAGGGGGEERKFLPLMLDNVTFYGLLPYSDLLSLAKGVDFFINPIKSFAQQSITNKLSDYISLGKPIISSQKSAEVELILSKLGGFQYRSGDATSLLAALKLAHHLKNRKICKNEDILKKFDRNRTYAEIEEFITAVD